MDKTDSQKLDMIFDAIVGMKQEIAEVKLKVTDIDQRLNKVEVAQEKMQGDIKTLAEGILSTKESLERKIDEAVEKINNRDDVQDKAIYKLTKVK